MNGAHWLVKTLQRRGVEYVFALCGNGLKPFLDACVDLGMPVVDVRNEQSAAYMADTWGRMTKRIGVVAVSAGPGHTNTLTGLANAFWDGGPDAPDQWMCHYRYTRYGAFPRVGSGGYGGTSL